MSMGRWWTPCRRTATPKLDAAADVSAPAGAAEVDDAMPSAGVSSTIGTSSASWSSPASTMNEPLEAAALASNESNLRVTSSSGSEQPSVASCPSLLLLARWCRLDRLSDNAHRDRQRLAASVHAVDLLDAEQAARCHVARPVGLRRGAGGGRDGDGRPRVRGGRHGRTRSGGSSLRAAWESATHGEKAIPTGQPDAPCQAGDALKGLGGSRLWSACSLLA